MLLSVANHPIAHVWRNTNRRGSILAIPVTFDVCSIYLLRIMKPVIRAYHILWGLQMSGVA